MVLAEFSMFPTDKGESVSRYVAKILDVVDRSGVNYQLTAMGTLLEGSWDEVMGVITQCFRTMEADSRRITVTFKADYRHGHASRLASKIEKVESILDRRLKR